MIGEFEQAYQYLSSLNGIQLTKDQKSLSISHQSSQATDGSEFIRIEMDDKGQKQIFFVSPTEGVNRIIWSDSTLPEIPTLELFDGMKVRHPYLGYIQDSGDRIVYTPLRTSGHPSERPYEERLQECLKRGITLAQQIRDFAASIGEDSSRR